MPGAPRARLRSYFAGAARYDILFPLFRLYFYFEYMMPRDARVQFDATAVAIKLASRRMASRAADYRLLARTAMPPPLRRHRCRPHCLVFFMAAMTTYDCRKDIDDEVYCRRASSSYHYRDAEYLAFTGPNKSFTADYFRIFLFGACG